MLAKGHCTMHAYETPTRFLSYHVYPLLQSIVPLTLTLELQVDGSHKVTSVYEYNYYILSQNMHVNNHIWLFYSVLSSTLKPTHMI